ncbi:hypothetical protein [Streptomyces bohaiensis]|uniref:DUF8175 domain-containing protein n=1 Tax=Streptomyces bohaiensis TaxID=1431344 RepID=A0ABX1C658_9ACTN|nr:hypothetical protein [Streptomyces bohaiensis]NJQ13533.1 hypothetical protein [Streptomyces bohaiensis]
MTAPPADGAPAWPERLGGHDQEHEGEHDQEATDGPDWSGLTYQDLHGAQLPLSPAHGPAEVSEVVASGFTRDEGGAAVAAVHLASRVGAQLGPDIYGPNVERMVGDISAMMAQVDRDYARARAASGLPESEPLRTYGRTIGYVMPLPPREDTPDVTVHLLGRDAGPAGGEILVVIPVTLTWEAGDWRLRVPPSARWNGQPVAAVDGFTLFPTDG